MNADMNQELQVPNSRMLSHAILALATIACGATPQRPTTEVDATSPEIVASPITVEGSRGDRPAGTLFGDDLGTNYGFAGALSSLQTDQPTNEGHLGRDEIREVVRVHLSEIRVCYEVQLRTQSELRGRIVVQFVIDGEGHVASATAAQRSLQNPDLETCVTNAVRTWTFPRPTGGGQVAVNYPFDFRTDEPVANP